MNISECNFSLKHYFDVLENSKKEYVIGPLKEFKKLKQNKKFIILRHDVDISLEYALNLAKKESGKDIHATYFVLLQGQYYNALSNENVKRIKEISNLGHEIGLHYDSSFATSKSQLTIQIKKMVNLLSDIIDKEITSIAQHDVSISPELNARDSNEFVDAMNSNLLNETVYIADSVQNWRKGCMCNYVGKVEHLYILTHPIWWSDKHSSRKKILSKFENDEINKIKKRISDSNNAQANYINGLKEGTIE